MNKGHFDGSKCSKEKFLEYFEFYGRNMIDAKFLELEMLLKEVETFNKKSSTKIFDSISYMVSNIS